MSWRELAWSGKMRRKAPDDESTGLVTAIGLTPGEPRAAPLASKARRLAVVPEAGVAVSLEPIRRDDDGKVSAVGRIRLGR